LCVKGWFPSRKRQKKIKEYRKGMKVMMDDEKSFQELLEEESIQNSYLRPGQKIEALIVKITPDWIFLDLGGKTEGYLERRELQDEEGNISVHEGDRISAYFLSSKHNEKLFTTHIGSGSTAQSFLEEAYENDIPVEGFVDKEIKGGFEIKISGNVLGFCPYSQMGLQKEDAQTYLGKKMIFQILEYGEKGRKLVLSSRILLEKEQKEKREARKETLSEGMTLKGKVVSLHSFGAFVDLEDGISGLIPMSELSWGRIDNIHDVLSVGDEVEVKISRIDREKDQISLSLKECLPDPWDTVDQLFFEGSVHSGRIVRLTNFGAFVNLMPGIDGLIHISKLGKGKRIQHPREVAAVGQTLDVKIEQVDRSQKRISLAPIQGKKEEVKTSEPEENYTSYVPQATSSSFGSLGDMFQTKLRHVKTKQ